MKAIDRLLQRWRFEVALPHVPAESRVLDVGCADAAIARQPCMIGEYVGIDIDLTKELSAPTTRLIKGSFPRDIPQKTKSFDVILLLAILEHITPSDHSEFGTGCYRHLVPGGRLIITVPSPWVDVVLAVLRTLRLIDGIHLDEHFGYDVRQTCSIFGSPKFEFVEHHRFELGLNHLFVFRRT